MATVGPVVETVSRKRVVPAVELQQEKTGRTTPEFWEFIEAMTPDMWASDYLLYILREDPKPSMYGGTNTLEKCPGYIAMPDGTQSRLSSREDIELAIKQKYGGKAFRLILKKGSERISEGKCINEAPPRMPDADPQYGRHPLPQVGAATDATVATRAIDAMASQHPEAVRLAMDVLSKTSEILMRQANPPVAPSSDSDLDRAFKQAMLAKMLAPPPDPIELMIKLKQLEGPGGNANPLVDKLMNAAVDRFMNPVAAAGTGRTTLLDLGREILPVVVTTAKEVMHEWRLGVEAQVRGVELSRGMNPQQPVAAIPAVPQEPVPAVPIAAVQPPANNAPSSEPPFDWLAIKIVEILKEPSYTIDEAVDETLSFLYRSHGPVVALLLDPPKINPALSAGEQGLLQLFQHHPVLKQVPVNPRLAEFIKKFTIAATKAEAERISEVTGAPISAAPAPAS